MAMQRPGKLLFALSGFAAVAVAATGALLLWQYREATLSGAAEREALVVNLRARQLAEEISGLVVEVGRLSRLAEVDLADGNLEPEKTVLRAARRDSAAFSVAVAVLDEQGEVLWAEPRDARPGGSAAGLVGLARGSARPVVWYEPGEIDVAAPVAGRGAIVGIVSDKSGRQLFGTGLRQSLRERGAVSLVLPGARGSELVVAAERTREPPPPLRLAGGGQGWLPDEGGRQWLVTEAPVPGTGLVLRSVLSGGDVEGQLTGPFRRLVALVAAAIGLAVAGVFALALLVRRLERAELEVARSRDLASMGKTAAAIAHEVKNALNGLSVAVDVLAGGRASPAAAATVHGRARTEIGRLREVADDLTLFAAAPRLAVGEVDVGQLCRDAAAAVAELAEDNAVEVRLALPDGEVPVRGDSSKLLGALVNLVRNGIEAMGPGAFGEGLGEAAPDRERRLELSARRRGGEAVVEVADRGAGLAPEVRERLFEPFVTTKRTGTGLGLAIVQRVVEAHGGRIEAEDRPGGGTVFRLALPAGGSAA